MSDSQAHVLRPLDQAGLARPDAPAFERIPTTQTAQGRPYAGFLATGLALSLIGLPVIAGSVVVAVAWDATSARTTVRRVRLLVAALGSS